MKIIKPNHIGLGSGGITDEGFGEGLAPDWELINPGVKDLVAHVGIHGAGGG